MVLFRYTGKLQTGNELHRVEEKLQNFHESTAVALAVKRDFKKAPKKKMLYVWDPWTLCQGLQEEGDSTMQQVL